MPFLTIQVTSEHFKAAESYTCQCPLQMAMKELFPTCSVYVFPAHVELCDRKTVVASRYNIDNWEKEWNCTIVDNCINAVRDGKTVALVNLTLIKVPFTPTIREMASMLNN